MFEPVLCLARLEPSSRARVPLVQEACFPYAAQDLGKCNWSCFGGEWVVWVFYEKHEDRRVELAGSVACLEKYIEEPGEQFLKSIASNEHLKEVGVDAVRSTRF